MFLKFFWSQIAFLSFSASFYFTGTPCRNHCLGDVARLTDTMADDPVGTKPTIFRVTARRLTGGFARSTLYGLMRGTPVGLAGDVLWEGAPVRWEGQGLYRAQGTLSCLCRTSSMASLPLTCSMESSITTT